MKRLNVNPIRKRISKTFAASWSLVSATIFLTLDSAPAITLSSPTLQSNVLSFSFDSAPDQLLTVQSSSGLDSGWSDIVYRVGTGAPMNFSAPITGDQQFFQVKTSAFQPLDLRPNTPTLAEGPVSLPD